MVRKWKLGATGTALLATTFVVVACSSKSDDDASNGGSGGTSAKGGTGGTTGGSTNAGKGGGTTGGTGGSTGGSTTGGTGGSTTGGTGGSTTGGSAGTGTTTGGSAGMGGAAPMPFTCAMTPATCNLIHTWTFNTTSQWQGTYTYQEASVMSDKATDPTKLHITGMVSNYDGFGIYTGTCSSLSGYTGVTFTLKGTTSSVDKPNTVKFVLQINPDEPIDTKNSKGACVGASGVDCISPSKVIMASDSPQTIMFSDLAGGKPIAAADLTQVLGLQWQIDPDASKTPFAIDLTLSDVTLIGTPVADCSAGASGGMGGMGSGGMSGAAGTGTGGEAAGQGGAATGGQGGQVTGGRGGNGSGGMTAGSGGRGNAGRGQGGA